MENGKVWWKSKTVWLNIALFLIWALSIVEGFTEDKVYVAILAIATMALNLVVRYLTGQPITLRDLRAIADKARELQQLARKNQPGWSATDGMGDSHGALTVEFNPGEKKDGE